MYVSVYMVSLLVQVMAYDLFGTTPYTEPLLPYCQLDLQEQILDKFQFNHLLLLKYIWKYCLQSH